MEEEFIYDLNGETLTIKNCPNHILDYYLINQIFYDNNISNVIICDGVEKIEYSTFSNCRNLKKVILPNTLITINDDAFSNCEQLREINIPSSVKYIKYNAFSGCVNLRRVNIPGSVKQVEHNVFYNCKKLKKVIIEEGVEELDEAVFRYCSSLKRIKLPSSIRFLGDGVFEECSSLRKIVIPEGVEELDNCFNGCKNLKRVILPSSIRVITNHSFVNCSSLSKIELPNNLEIIGSHSFEKTGLWKINVPSSVKIIGEDSFRDCNYLFDVILNDGLKNIGHSAFMGCHNLIEISIPDTVTNIDTQAFRLCANLREIKLSKNLDSINHDVFSSCYKLKKVEIPEGVTSVELSAFDKCQRLQEIYLPLTIKKVDKEYFTQITNLERIFIQCNDGKKEIDVRYKRFINNDEGILFLYDNKTSTYSFYNEGEYVEFHKVDLEQKEKAMRMVQERELLESDYIKLYYWINKRIIPSSAVIETMPIRDIDMFFINKNCNEWAKLVKESGITYVDNIKSFFKLCYVLGVFSESTALRDKAVNFMRESIIGKLRGMDIHARFDGFNLSNGFNKEYAEFFMKYYNGKNFMISTINDEEKIDLMASSYNNFKQVKKIYPNRTLHTNRNADLLLAEHVMNAVSTIEYDCVDEGNEELAALVSRYGYNNEQFEMLQEWYNKAKKIKKEQMKLFISDDKESKGINYELLSKDNPIAVILGNITNCCQVIDGAGGECVEYGLIKPNSGFITFNYQNKIIGQAWVWYDEDSKTICLDNIEIPHRYLEKINENKQIQESFIKCLLRIQENFKKEMENHHLEVNKVTIGKGYNDIVTILDKKFETDNNATKLSEYNGYSDAKRQFEIKRKR